MENTSQNTATPREPQRRYNPLCEDWFQTAGDIDDFIFYGEDCCGSER